MQQSAPNRSPPFMLNKQLSTLQLIWAHHKCALCDLSYHNAHLLQSFCKLNSCKVLPLAQNSAHQLNFNSSLPRPLNTHTRYFINSKVTRACFQWPLPSPSLPISIRTWFTHKNWTSTCAEPVTVMHNNANARLKPCLTLHPNFQICRAPESNCQPPEPSSIAH